MPDDQQSRMLAIILGASTFPNAPNLAEGRAFYISAADLREYLCDQRGLALPRRNILSLFDDSRSPSEQLMEVASFLVRRDLELKNEGTRAEDLLIYYVGHGLFTRGDQAYCLAVRSTNQINEGATSIRAGDLAGVIKEKAAFLRRYLILDCCFAANIQKEFQSGALSAVRVQIANEFPERGTALLCSSNAHVPSLAPQGLEHTMFSNALIQALRQGHEAAGPRLSFSELGALISENIRNAYPDDYVRPEVHSPDQREGDIAHIPLFPNPAWREPSGSDEARRGQDRQKRAGAERAGQKAEKEGIPAQETLAREKAEAREKERRAKQEQAAQTKKTAEIERLAREKAEQERQAREKSEAEHRAKEKAEQERVAREAERKQAQEKAEAERVAEDKAEPERDAWLIHVNRGHALRKKGDVKAAIAEYQQAIRLDPQNDIPRVSLADALDGIGKLDEAMTECHQALRLKPDSVEAHYRLGLFSYEKYYVGNLRKDLSSAVAEYGKTLRLNPKHALAHHGLAEALQKKGDSAEALEHFRVASELEPKIATFRDDYQKMSRAEAKRVATMAEAGQLATETAEQERVVSKRAAAGKTVDPVEPPGEPAKAEPPRQPLAEPEQLFSQSEIKRRSLSAIEVLLLLAVAVILAVFFWTCHTSPPASETTSPPNKSARLQSGGAANFDPDLFRKPARPTWQDLVIPQGVPIEIELVRTIKPQGRNQYIESVAFSPDGRLWRRRRKSSNKLRLTPLSPVPARFSCGMPSLVLWYEFCNVPSTDERPT
jgi:tetratricopeptide (TPR) repeat protein